MTGISGSQWSLAPCYCVKQFSWMITFEYLHPEMHHFRSDSGRTVGGWGLGEFHVILPINYGPKWAPK